MSKSSGDNPHRVLTFLVAANIVLDFVAIAIWAALPANTWNGMYRLDSLIASSEAAFAAAIFAIVLFGLRKGQKWAPFLAIAITVTQRIFAAYVFFPSIAIPIPLIWSVVIIYFALEDVKLQNSRP
jgi:hypothetical protein